MVIPGRRPREREVQMVMYSLGGGVLSGRCLHTPYLATPMVGGAALSNRVVYRPKHSRLMGDLAVEADL